MIQFLFLILFHALAFAETHPCTQIKGVQYFYSETPHFSGRACAAMLLTKLLDPEVVSPRELIVKGQRFADDIVGLGQLFKILGIDHFQWTIFESFDEIKDQIDSGHPVILEGFFDLNYKNYEIPTNKILVIGYNSFGLIVHDPCGFWTGPLDRSHDQEVFSGRNALYLFKDLDKLFEDGALISWATSFMK